MSIQLTPQQQQALDAQGGGHPRPVIDPRTNAAYVLVPEGDYDAVRELLDEERRQRGRPGGGPAQRGRPHGRRPMIQPGEVYAADFGPAGPHPSLSCPVRT